MQPRNADKLRRDAWKAGARARGLQLEATWNEGLKKRCYKDKQTRHSCVVDRRAQSIEETSEDM